jgi:adenylate kinase family enzyme
MILLITGPCAVGKTTISKLISKQYGLKYIGGDDIKNKLYPKISKINEFPEKLDRVYLQLFNTVKENFDKNINIVLDYIFLKQISTYQTTFKHHLTTRILLPTISTIVLRDQQRICWTAGTETISYLYPKFTSLKKTLPIDYFIDSSNETPQQTLEKHFSPLLNDYKKV